MERSIHFLTDVDNRYTFKLVINTDNFCIDVEVDIMKVFKQNF